MKVLTLPFHYIAWHYSHGVADLWQTFTNILWFIKSFFSFKILLRTMFMPWQRLRERYDRRRGLGDILGSLFINILMRIIGTIIRSVTFLVGAFVYVLFLIIGLLFFIAWFLIPPLMVFLFITGILAIIFNGQFDLNEVVI